jgi:hypothetical protein
MGHFKILFYIMHGGNIESHRKLNHESSQPPGQVMNAKPSEYEGLQNTQPLSLVG